MALIVITVQDTPNGAVVSLAAEPAMDMSAAPAGEAQQLVHLMLGALPMNGPAAEVEDPICPECGGQGCVHSAVSDTPAAAVDPGVKFPM